MNHPICALDVASTSVEVCFTDSCGQKIKQLGLQANDEGHARLVSLLQPGTRVIMESTGDYHRSWARACANAGFEVYVLNALFAKNLTSSGNALRKNKTDRIDAQELARAGFVQQHELRNYRFRECEHQMANRELIKLRSRLVDNRRDQCNVASHMLRVMMPTSSDLVLSEREKIQDLFLGLRSLQHLRSMRKSTLQRFAFSQTETLISASHSPLVNVTLFDLMLPALQAILNVIKNMTARITEIETLIEETMEKGPLAEDLALAQTLPGIGKVTATTLIAHLPDTWRSWGSKQKIMRKIQAYFGFDPKQRESGLFKGQVRMSKRGHAAGRTALYHVAITSLKNEGMMYERYHTMRQLGKHHGVAISHLMRLHLRRLIAVLYDRTPYQPDFLLNRAQN